MKKKLTFISFVLLFAIQISWNLDGYAQPLNNWLQFDGFNDYVSLGNSLELKPPSAITLETWVFREDWSIQESFMIIGNANNGGYTLETYGVNLIFAINLNGTFFSIMHPYTGLSAGWHHFAATYDGVMFLRLYIDGIPVTNQPAGSFLIQDNMNNCTFLGAAVNNACSPNGGYFEGFMDDVRIWGIARSATEINDNMNVNIPASSTGLRGYWKLNETSGLTAHDETAYQNDGALCNMTGNEWQATFTELSHNIQNTYNGSIDMGDYDNDHDLDIILTGSTSTAMGSFYSKIYSNDGNGTFTATSASLTQYEDSDAAWGDYDNDSDLDLLMSGSTNLSYQTNVYTHNGAGGFSKSNFHGIAHSSLAWEDYDNDGWLDFVMAGVQAVGSSVTKIYRNTCPDGTGLFQDASISLPGYIGVAKWGDCNQDGYPDLFLAGSGSGTPARFYINDGNGGFNNSSNSFPTADKSDADLGDYDNDGDLDIIICYGAIAKYTLIYKNNGNGGFSNSGISLPGVNNGSVAWGDYNNDGYVDILLSGGNNNSEYVTMLLKNDRDGGFVLQDEIPLHGVNYSSVTWADIDNDFDLDILYNGWDGSAIVTKIYRNNSIFANSVPTVPTNLVSLISGNDVTLSWNVSNDNETPSDGLSYNVYIGTSPGACDALTPMADLNNGYRYVPALGNAGLNTSKIMRNLKSGFYYWSVQAVDNGFAGSEFAQEGLFYIQVESADTIPGTALAFDGSDDLLNIGNNSSLDVGNTLTIEAWVKPGSSTGRHSIFSTRSNNSGGSFQLEIGPAAGGTHRVAVSGVNTWVAQTGDNVFSDNEWVHIAYTRSGSGAGTHAIYINGLAQTLISNDPYSFINNGDDKYIGAGTNGTQHFIGEIDEVRFWSVARSQQQIRESIHHTVERDTPGLISYWQMNENKGVLSADHTGVNTASLEGNMNPGAWTESTVPTGGGASNTQTETTGTVIFTGTGLTIDYSSQNGASVTVTKINNAPNVLPDLPTSDNRYWVANRYGSGSFNANLIFSVSNDLVNEYESSPGEVKLYRRASNSDGAWEFAATASDVDTAMNTVTFNNISSFSQFIICHNKRIYNFAGHSLFFGGDNDYVNVGNNGSLNTGNIITIEAWIKPWLATSRNSIFSTRKDNADGGFQLEIGPGNGGTNRVAVTGKGVWVAQTGNDAIVNGQWNHIVYTRSGSGAGTHNIYVNGKLQTLITDDPYPFIDNTSDKLIGSTDGSSGFFNGQIDEVRLWNIALDSIQIRENMHLPLTGQETGLVSYWQFNEGSGNETYECSLINNGTLINMAEENWDTSTIPFGPGASDSQVENFGSVEYTNTGITMNYSAQSGASVTVTRIDTLPNQLPSDPVLDSVFQEQYWVINRFGAGAFNAEVTFTLSEDLTSQDMNNASKFHLYRREVNSDGEWSLYAGSPTINPATDQITFSGITGFSQFIIAREPYSPDFQVNLTAFIEGPFNGSDMNTTLNSSSQLPLSQPYNTAPWNYSGTESVTSIPNSEVVDWILIELRDATDAASAGSAAVVARQAAFLLKDGSIVGTDGSSILQFSSLTVQHSLFAVIRHRNHIAVMSSEGLQLSGTTYSWDFTTGSGQAFGGSNAHKDIAPGIWGMTGADGNADGQINNGDKNDVWAVQAGTGGYKSGDFNLDAQVNNGDKNDVWTPNTGLGGQVPDYAEASSGKPDAQSPKCYVPE
ncbi:MAG: VCBS repeat-containing protein [Bacteroidales bacterium]|nr:VCBS repeat-containing protein [Bacteroidales bacterium]